MRRILKVVGWAIASVPFAVVFLCVLGMYASNYRDDEGYCPNVSSEFYEEKIRKRCERKHKGTDNLFFHSNLARYDGEVWSVYFRKGQHEFWAIVNCQGQTDIWLHEDTSEESGSPIFADWC